MYFVNAVALRLIISMYDDTEKTEWIRSIPELGS